MDTEAHVLVLSRKQNQDIVFPNLGIILKLLRVEGRTAVVGVEAPRDVVVLRSELAHTRSYERAGRRTDGSSGLSHDERNRLNNVTLGLELVRRLIARGKFDDVDATLDGLLRDLQSLDNAAGRAKAPARPAGRARRRALLVEDNKNESELLAGYLRTHDFAVTQAADGSEALARLEREECDVVLMDIDLPGVGGDEAVRKIRANPRTADLKVFAVTGAEPGAAGIAIGPSGVDYWFQKPLEPASLIRQLQLALAG
jgi:CheY-like chemotaxis protein/sRNA-binding carbon storage regulator CsrA